GGSLPPRASRLGHEDREPFQALRTNQDINDVAVCLAQQSLAFLLRDAPGDGDYRTMPAGFLPHHADLAEARVELFFRLLTDAAGVDHDDVGVAIVLGTVVSRLLQQPRHALGVVLVHLTTEGLN